MFFTILSILDTCFWGNSGNIGGKCFITQKYTQLEYFNLVIYMLYIWIYNIIFFKIRRMQFWFQKMSFRNTNSSDGHQRSLYSSDCLFQQLIYWEILNKQWFSYIHLIFSVAVKYCIWFQNVSFRNTPLILIFLL